MKYLYNQAWLWRIVRLFSEVTKSIKARLYDMRYTPFLASYVFFFFYFNAKLFLIFLSSDLTTLEKINLLSYEMVDYLKPFCLALTYTVAFPFFQLGLYWITLQYKKYSSYIQQKIQDKTPLPQEKANQILRDNAELQIQLDNKIDELNKVKSRYEVKETSLIEEYKEKSKLLDSEIKTKVSEQTEYLRQEISELKDLIKKHVAENQKLQQELNKYKAEQNKEENTESGFSNVEKEVLRVFFDKDSRLYKNELKTLVSEHLTISKATVELAIENLINMKLITLRENMLELTSEGLKLVDEMFTK